ncbi:MAG TPA: hypothetical protein VHX87_07370 [Galbitalea sp.]|nr:hypothetical protein [Galbitalea sp.]
MDARRWVDAATEARDKAIEVGAAGVDVAGRVGGEALSRGRSAAGKLSTSIADEARRRFEGDEDDR